MTNPLHLARPRESATKARYFTSGRDLSNPVTAEDAIYVARKRDKGELLWLPTNILKTIEKFQRSTNTLFLKKYDVQFDWALFGVLNVMLTEDEEYHVFDGQHRLKLAIASGIEEVPCIVHTWVSHEDLADLFVSFNTARRNPTAWDVHRVGKNASHGVSRELEGLIEQYHFTMRPHTRTSPRNFRNVKYMGGAFLRSRKAMRAALSSLDTLLDDDETILPWIFDALFRINFRILAEAKGGDYKLTDEEIYLSRLNMTSQNKLQAEYLKGIARGDKMGWRSCAKILLRSLNYRLTQKNRITIKAVKLEDE